MIKSKFAFVVVGVMLTFGLGASPAFAAGGVDIIVADDTCDFLAAGLGAGTAADPFRIGTPTQLAEINDCHDDYKYYVLTSDIDLASSEDAWNSVANGG